MTLEDPDVLENRDDLKEADDVPKIGIAEVLRTLPLCDELYLSMQAMNLGIVDGFLEQQEVQLLTEYMETERTPLPTVMFVSALSQMWIFALYEFLRTWRQRARDGGRSQGGLLSNCRLTAGLWEE